MGLIESMFMLKGAYAVLFGAIIGAVLFGNNICKIALFSLFIAWAFFDFNYVAWSGGHFIGLYKQLSSSDPGPFRIIIFYGFLPIMSVMIMSCLLGWLNDSHGEGGKISNKGRKTNDENSVRS